MQRLKTRVQFQAVLAGTIVAKTAHFALHRSLLDVPTPADSNVQSGKAGVSKPLFRQQDIWIGAMVPKRWAKRAATRNAMKRLIYAASHEVFQSFPPSAFVVRLRSGFAKSEFPSAVSDQLKQAVRAEIQALMETGIKTA